MADRIASTTRFRAEGALVGWGLIARRQLQHLGEHDLHDRDRLGPELAAFLERLIGQRPEELHLRWASAARIGVPPAPFTVWVHDRLERRPQAELLSTSVPGGELLTWDGRTAAVVEVECDPLDPARPVALWGFRGASVLPHAVGVEVVQPTGPGRLSILLRAGGMTRALLVNAALANGSVDLLRDVVQDDGWRELEVVGLPVDGSSGYDGRPQGLVDAPLDPRDAAIDRLVRGGPPVGWWPVTESGHPAPPWEPPDYKLLVREVVEELLPVVAPMWSVPPPQQAELVHREPMLAPEQAGRAARPATPARDATLPPFGALMLAGTTDPFLALATGFGTAYPLDQRDDRLHGRDLMVTADYQETPEGGPATYAAYVPWPGTHTATAPVTGLHAVREGLVRPLDVDLPWRETVRLRWQHVAATAALGRPSGVGTARFESAPGAEAESMLTPRDAGGWRTLVPTLEPSMPGHPSGHTPGDHDRAVDAAVEIPLGSGGRTSGYAVAVHDVFGVWSRWEDVTYVGVEPAAPMPRVMSVRLDTHHTGSTSCPSALEVHVALDWSDRTPASVEVVAMLFPATASGAAPPASAHPGAPTPPGCLRSDVLLTFIGDEANVPAPVTVAHLDPTGEPAAPGPAQSQEGRRYALRWAGPSLDYAAARWWGLAVWAREKADALPAPGAWAPQPAPPAPALTPVPALSHAASPVPPSIPVPPPLPGVPVGSTPDAQGRSHVRVRWPAPVGDVESFRVWELTEGAVRSVRHDEDATVALRPAPGAPSVPGARLVWLRDQLVAGVAPVSGPVGWRGRFRRVAEVPGSAREADVALERGTADIHLFAVTAIAPSGVESPWPASVEAVQAFMAPRVLAPAAPVLRSRFGMAAGGVPTLELDMESASSVLVDTFELFQTRSVVAARTAETMGPPFASVPATLTTGVSSAGEPVYTGHWSGPVPLGWEPTRYRAVAMPVAAVPVSGVVGAPSPGSPVVLVDVPPAAGPDLDELTVDDFDGTGVVVRTSTTVPARTTPTGPFVLSVAVTGAGGDAATAGADVAAPVTADWHEVVALDDLEPVPGTVGSGAAVPSEVRRGPRASGRTPLAVWFRRPAAADPVRVVVRLADPLGRVVEQALAVPGGALGQPPTLEIIDTFVIVGRGAVVRWRSDAPVVDGPDGPHRLLVRARTSVRGPSPLRPPFRPFPGGEGGGLPPRRPPIDIGDLLRRWTTVEVDLPDVEQVRGEPVMGRQARMLVVRTSDGPPYDYQLLVRLATPIEVQLTVVAPEGLRAHRSVYVGRT